MPQDTLRALPAPTSDVYGPRAPATQDLPRRTMPGGLPAPVRDPLRIDPAADPILQLARASSSANVFQSAIGAAVRRNPGLDESIAQREESEAARNEARARQYPVVDVSLSNFQVLSRAFSNDPGNLLERQRPGYRTDGTFRAQQPVFDFGASGNRIRAGNARLEAAVAGIEDTSAQIALRAISAWYNVYGYRALERLARAFAMSQSDLRDQVQERVQMGMAARGDVAQVDGYIASAGAQLADFRRSLANAESQYAELVGTPAPPTLGRAPPPDLTVVARDSIRTDAERLPTVRAARSAANAAGLDVKAVKSDRLPAVTVGMDAGRYGIIETDRDYDIRANVTLAMRLGGGAAQRVDQAQARSNGAEARFRRTREEAERDAQIAWSDVAALEEAQSAIEENYIASRQSRDVLVERFRVSRGTLFDVLAAESNYFGVAARYIQTVTELDTARYVLLARTGKLLGALRIDPASLDRR